MQLNTIVVLLVSGLRGDLIQQDVVRDRANYWR